MPPQVNMDTHPVDGLCKIVLPFWVHDINADVKIHLKDNTIQGFIDSYHGLTVASLKMDQPGIYHYFDINNKNRFPFVFPGTKMT